MRANEILIELNMPNVELGNFKSMKEIEQIVKNDPDWKSYFKFFGWVDPFNVVPENNENVVSRMFYGPIEKWHYSFYNVPQIVIKGTDAGSADRTMLKYDLNGNDITEKTEYSDNYMSFPTIKRNIEAWIRKDLKKVKKDLNKLKGKFYIRFGGWPKNERSKNYLASRNQGEDVFEKGISVYNTSWDIEAQKWDIETDVNPATISGTMSELFYGKMPVYLITGNELKSLGSDDEPLLRNVKIVQTLSRKDIQVPGIFDQEND